jgi:CheY-like chemotaxis protein
MVAMLVLCYVGDPIDFSDYILLAEDNPADVQLVREALEDRAVTCRLRVAADGDQAIKFIEQVDRDSTVSCPKLLLLDLHLPGHDGEAILRRLRASERCGQTPVVILTSSDSPRDREKAAANAALHYFRKPATLEQFLQLGDIVANILDPKAPLTAPQRQR